MELAGARIHITGVVQGVGFRPFVFGLAQRMQLTGWVRNSTAGVDIEVDGTSETIALFAESIKTDSPSLAFIDQLEVTTRSPNGYASFEIVESQPTPNAFQPVSADITVCPDCLQELLDPKNRRYRYPFINCTNCGPRYTIIRDVPYDRPNTTMGSFPMCSECLREYLDPLDRRFHAQPIACPQCGPHIWIELPGSISGPTTTGDQAALQYAREKLRTGHILAIKGLGGFHLACDATNPAAVAELRRRKLRVDKPFAVMAADSDIAERYCWLDSSEKSLLESRERPIVILRRRQHSAIVSEVAPGQQTVGVMLPYTPLHQLLLEPAAGFPDVLVMTSGNLSDEPIAYSNDEARDRLAPLADAFLLHNRGIQIRCDDSVMRSITDDPGASNRRKSIASVSMPFPLRRSRGYAPFPVMLPWEVPPMLAVGGELKNSFCVARSHYAFLSHHIGDLENYQTLRSFEEGISHLENLFHLTPELIAYDLHPDYLATRYAKRRAGTQGIDAYGIQHHHAHIAACLAEHKHSGEQPVIGVAFDGTGYGDDGTLWGGEFLVANYYGYHRVAHLQTIPLPGGDAAVREPWRTGLSYLIQAGVDGAEELFAVQGRATTGGSGLPPPLEIVEHQIRSGINSPATSSMGRLFDGVAAITGVRHQVTYEAQAAIEFEAIVDSNEAGQYPLFLNGEVIETSPMIREVVADVRNGAHAGVIAARFHNSVAHMVLAVCRQLRQKMDIDEVVLSGGVWQNVTLFRRTIPLLDRAGFKVYTHQLVPSNDGGLSLGQAAVAACRNAGIGAETVKYLTTA